MFAYKLVSQDFTTKNNTEWRKGVTVEAIGGSNDLCTDGLLHFYTDKHIAVLMNPNQANIKDPRLIQISCSEVIATDGLKYGCKRQTMVRELQLPKITINQKIAFGILCALEVYENIEFKLWARNWLYDIDRSRDAAKDAASAISAEYATACSEYASAAEHAASVSAYAKYVKYAASVSAAKYVAADYATAAVSAAASAAKYAVSAAAEYAAKYAVSDHNSHIDFIYIVKQALTYR